MLSCNSDGDLYTFPAATSTAPHASIAVTSTLWHHRLGHLSSATLETLQNNSSISCDKTAHTIWHSCQLGKHVRLHFSNSSSRSSVPFELVHCDVWTSPVASIFGYRWYLVILDDYTHYCWTFPLAHKSDVLSNVTNFCPSIQTQFGLPIRTSKQITAQRLSTV